MMNKKEIPVSEPFNPIKWAKRFKEAFQNCPDFIVSRTLWSLRHAWLPWIVLPITIKNKDGTRFFLSSDQVDHLILRGIFERYVELYFPNCLDNIPPGSWFLDIGAHHGFYTVSVLTRYPMVKIIAVEPDPSSVNLLRRNLALNKLQDRVEIIQAAMDLQNGEGWLCKSNEGSWGDYLSTTQPVSVANRINVVDVKSVLQGRIPYLVKCNCEGCEFSIIPALLEQNIYPNYFLLFAHPEFGNVDTLLHVLKNARYDVIPTCDSLDHRRFICLKR